MEGLTVDVVPGNNDAILNGENVETEIRGGAVSGMVSPVATISAVRRWIVPQQREMGKAGGIVMDGRDIGTVVFPDADLKLFVTASMDIRTNRRLAELEAKGITATREEVAINLGTRDHIDSSREDSPLRQAEDAIVVDNSALSLEAFIEAGMDEVKKIR